MYYIQRKLPAKGCAHKGSATMRIDINVKSYAKEYVNSMFEFA